MNVLSVTDTATTPPPTTSRGRIVPFIVGAAAVLLLVPVALYFWFIHQYGVNVIRYDQWNDVALLTHTPFFHYRNAPTYSHTTIGAMWAQHGEDRTFFPDLVVLALGRLTSLNVLTELYLSAVLLVIACADHLRSSTGRNPYPPGLLPSRGVWSSLSASMKTPCSASNFGYI